MNAADPAEGPTLSAFGKTGAGLVVGRSLQQIGEASARWTDFGQPVRAEPQMRLRDRMGELSRTSWLVAEIG